jgi:thiol-disulfide isomerase/thioredoxin
MNPMLSAVLALSIPLAACSADAPPTAGESATTSPQASAAPAEPVQPAADIERPALKIATLDGAQYDLAAKRGRWVVVNFWATWCSPCLKEMPELDALDAEREDIEVLGLAYEEIEPADLRAFLAKRPVKYPVAIVDVYDPPADFPTPRGLPMTHVIAPDGKVAKRFMGPVTKDEVAAVVDGAGSGAKVSAAASK